MPPAATASDTTATAATRTQSAGTMRLGDTVAAGTASIVHHQIKHPSTSTVNPSSHHHRHPSSSNRDHLLLSSSALTQQQRDRHVLQYIAQTEYNRKYEAIYVEQAEQPDVWRRRQEKQTEMSEAKQAKLKQNASRNTQTALMWDGEESMRKHVHNQHNHNQYTRPQTAGHPSPFHQPTQQQHQQPNQATSIPWFRQSQPQPQSHQPQQSQQVHNGVESQLAPVNKTKQLIFGGAVSTAVAASPSPNESPISSGADSPPALTRASASSGLSSKSNSRPMSAYSMSPAIRESTTPSGVASAVSTRPTSSYSLRPTRSSNNSNATKQRPQSSYTHPTQQPHLYHDPSTGLALPIGSYTPPESTVYSSSEVGGEDNNYQHFRNNTWTSDISYHNSKRRLQPGQRIPPAEVRVRGIDGRLRESVSPSRQTHFDSAGSICTSVQAQLRDPGMDDAYYSSFTADHVFREKEPRAVPSKVKWKVAVPRPVQGGGYERREDLFVQVVKYGPGGASVQKKNKQKKQRTQQRDENNDSTDLYAPDSNSSSTSSFTDPSSLRKPDINIHTSSRTVSEQTRRNLEATEYVTLIGMPEEEKRKWLKEELRKWKREKEKAEVGGQPHHRGSSQQQKVMHGKKIQAQQQQEQTSSSQKLTEFMNQWKNSNTTHGKNGESTTSQQQVEDDPETSSSPPRDESPDASSSHPEQDDLDRFESTIVRAASLNSRSRSGQFYKKENRDRVFVHHQPDHEELLEMKYADEEEEEE